jgi:hypothetical protein
MKALIGKTITELHINDDQSVLVFTTASGELFAYSTEGDCCSESWWADITGVSALLGGTVATAEEVSMDSYNVEDGRSRQCSDEAYGYKLTTNKGYVDLVFRNSSNGYYGGWMEAVICATRPAGMTPITDDWRA